MREWLKETLSVLKEAWGCPRSVIKLHFYQWGMGPNAEVAPDGLVKQHGGGWWLYCSKCGRRVWDDADDA